MPGKDLDVQDVRLAFWQRLVAEEVVTADDVDRELLPLVRGGPRGEQMAYVLLRACVTSAEGMGSAMKRNLRAALIHWFSHVGSPIDPERREPVDPRWLSSVIGQRLTWADSARLVGGNPEDYSAYRRLVDCLQEAVRSEWERSFGTPCPFPGGE